MEPIPESDLLSALDQRKRVPLLKWLIADTHTPVTAFHALRQLPAIALLESVEGGERWGRYSVIAVRPRRLLFWDREGTIHEEKEGKRTSYPPDSPPLSTLRRLVREFPFHRPSGELPRFLGGLVGFVGYGLVSKIEPKVPDDQPESLPFPEALFFEIDEAVLFDNIRHSVALLKILHPDPHKDPHQILEEGEERLEELACLLMKPHPLPPLSLKHGDPLPPFEPLQEKQAFLKAVEIAREAIRAGEAIQVVLSQRFKAGYSGDPFLLYRSLRIVNPSPYLFYFSTPNGELIGSSPEILTRLEGGMAIVRPIAGTRRRGKTPEEDRALAEELLHDPKELSEHVMLVDLGRNDLGRVAKPGTVRMDERLVIERYSHVMHIVSQVSAPLKEGADFLDLFLSTFPAGTVSGAPKIRAMQMIAELEPIRRGPYAGALGYVSYDGNMDFCIIIRTLFSTGGELFAQTGAGIVADSIPLREYEETLNKARGLFRAYKLLEEGAVGA